MQIVSWQRSLPVMNSWVNTFGLLSCNIVQLMFFWDLLPLPTELSWAITQRSDSGVFGLDLIPDGR